MSNIDENIIWTEEKCLQLIREYKSRPSLWDSRDIQFYRQSARPEEWESIGRALNISAHDCKYKMNILMSSFRREKAKFINGLRIGRLFVSSWFAFKDMSFLLNRKIDSKRKLSKDIAQALMDHQYQLQNTKSAYVDLSVNNETVYEKDEECDYDIKLEPDTDDESDLDSGDPISVPTPGPSQEKCDTVKTYNVETSTDPIDIEEITAFTNFINTKMKKYSEKTIIAVEKAILNVLFKADRNYYENDNYEALEASTSSNITKRKIALKRKRESEITTSEEKDQAVESSD